MFKACALSLEKIVENSENQIKYTKSKNKSMHSF